jgi:hypothetical protein
MAIEIPWRAYFSNSFSFSWNFHIKSVLKILVFAMFSPKLDLPPQDHSSFLVLKMLRKEANKWDSILGLAVSVKHLSGYALDLFAVLKKLAFPFGRLDAPLSLKIVQRGAADTARDLSIGVKHREPKQHPVNVVSERFAPPQYHCNVFPDPTIKMLFRVVERVAAWGSQARTGDWLLRP